MSFTGLQKTVIMGSLIFPLKISPFPLGTVLFVFVCFVLFTILLQHNENALTSLWMDVYRAPQI